MNELCKLLLQWDDHHNYGYHIEPKDILFLKLKLQSVLDEIQREEPKNAE